MNEREQARAVLESVSTRKDFYRSADAVVTYVDTRVALDAMLAFASSPRPTAAETRAWLVERTDTDTPTWYAAVHTNPHHPSRWTTDASKAVRFCREQDANEMVLLLNTVTETNAIATEHAWPEATSRPTAAGPSRRKETLDEATKRITREATDATQAVIADAMDQRFGPTAAEQGEGVPAGMVPWSGGESAPADWNGGIVMYRRSDGSIHKLRIGSRESEFWSQVTAYTPRPPRDLIIGILRSAMRLQCGDTLIGFEDAADRILAALATQPNKAEAGETLREVKAFDAARAECQRVVAETEFASDVTADQRDWFKRGAQTCAASMNLLASDAAKRLPLSAALPTPGSVA